jgi:hypothetical protein
MSEVSLQFVPRDVRNRPSARGHPVVNDHRQSVPAQSNVRLDPVDAETDGSSESVEGVFGSLDVVTAMGEKQHSRPQSLDR